MNRDADHWKDTHGRPLFTVADRQARRRLWWACCTADKYVYIYHYKNERLLTFSPMKAVRRLARLVFACSSWIPSDLCHFVIQADLLSSVMVTLTPPILNWKR